MQHVSDKHYRRPGMGSLTRYAAVFTGWRRLCVLTALLCGVATPAAADTHESGVTPAPVLGDLNGDGRDDVLLRHENGRWFYYPMDGRSHITDQRGYADLTRNLDWQFAGIGDLNGDERDDVLMRHTDGRWFYYPMDGRYHITGERGLAGLTRNLDWHVVGIGDLNGDGKDDVLLRNKNGRWYYYPMNGRRYLADERGYADLTRDLDWQVAGIGDLNGDGRDDVLLRHTDGRWDYYPMDGRNPIADQRGLAGLTRNLAWSVAGIGDLNGDGRDDVLLRHTDSRWYYYPMNGRRFLTDARGYAGLTRNLAWQVAGIGDLNGDGRDDVLLRHADSRWYYYPMDGRNYLTDGRGYANLTRNPDWSIAAAGAVDSTPELPTQTDGPDLVVESPRVSDNSLSPGQTFTFNATVRNSGSGASNSTTLRYYRSSDSTINSLDTEVGTASVSGLPASGSASVSVTLTAPSTAGTYYYGACVDNVTGENNTSNNCSNGAGISVVGPDLVVVTPEVSDSTPVSGGSFTLSVTVRNQGTFSSASTQLRYYRSSDSRITPEDTEVGASLVGSLSAATNSFESITLRAPSEAGSYFYGACVEPVTGESDTSNNCSNGAGISVVGPDLVVVTPWVSDNLPAPGGSFTLSVTVRNQGTFSSASTQLRYYRSSDSRITPEDTEVGASLVSSLSAATNSFESITLRAPSEDGSYFYGACVEPVTGESDTGNNCSGGAQIWVDTPDLVLHLEELSGLTPPESTLTLMAGETFTLSVEVINQGLGPSEATQLRYYRSSDSRISREDTEVGAVSVGSLSGSANSSASITLQAPSAAGTYYYGACVDSVTGESYTDNNCIGWNTITVVDAPDGTAIVPEMVSIPGGTFRMGDNREETVHRVTVPAFKLGKYEVTFSQWDACMADRGCHGSRPDDEGWGRGNHPVINVSWDEAQSFIDWLNDKTGSGYRLPSEAEWEYAARAGTTTRYSWGNDIGRNRANCRNIDCGDSYQYTAPVGSFPANAWGLHDMHGNIFEMTEDCWNDSYAGAPSDGSAWTSGDCSRSPRRSGSFSLGPDPMVVYVRSWIFHTGHNSHQGFRLAQDN